MFNPVITGAAINDGALTYNAAFEAFLQIFKEQEFEAEMAAFERTENELGQFEHAIETIRVHGLDAGLRDYLDAAGELSTMMPGTFPSAESWAPHAFTNMSCSALAMTIAGMESAATTAIADLANIMGRKFGGVAAMSVRELAKHEQYLTRFAAGTKSLNGIPKNVQRDLKLMPRAAIDEAIKAIQDARTLLDKNFRSVVKNEKELASWMESLNEASMSFASRCPWLKTVPQFSGGQLVSRGAVPAAAKQSESFGLVMHPVVRGNVASGAGVKAASDAAAAIKAPVVEAVPAAQSGMAAPGAIQAEAAKAAESTKGWTIGGSISSFFSRLWGMLKTVGRHALSALRAIGRFLYWVLNTVTFGGLNWIRNHLAPAAKAAGAQIDTAGQVAADAAGTAAGSAAKTAADAVNAAAKAA